MNKRQYNEEISLGRQSTKEVSNSLGGQAHAHSQRSQRAPPTVGGVVVVCLPNEREFVLETLRHTNKLLAEENIAGTDHSTWFYMLTTVSLCH